MKFHDCTTAPSPRRVRIFMAEKGIEIPTVQVDLRTGEQMGEAFRRLNPWCTVPVLELDDGTCISEVSACCRYLEAAHPEPPLMGRDPREVGVIAMWDHHCEVDGIAAVAEVLRNRSKYMVNRAIAGPHDYAQIPELADRGERRIGHFFDLLNDRLADNEFVAGDGFSVADISAMVAVDFAGWVKQTLPEGHVHARRWHAAVSARPSAQA
ncbi:MAG: glutathione S-transferase N-terminal domain-containing protein [Hyphomicrobiales bacterium]|nr:glutathione S-transferase N-terminal domain-containing protein [Hyphomicrobiales bacterium]MCP5373998.1 glutathione S-transferase N-terminal domain-containing protein [Hyphomicrobiales bacterium]